MLEMPALPLDAEESTEAVQVKSIKLFGVSAIDNPGLTGVEESGQHYCTVDLQLDDETETNVELALAILLLISVSMLTALESVLPR